MDTELIIDEGITEADESVATESEPTAEVSTVTREATEEPLTEPIPEEEATDYSRIVEEDILALKSEFAELASMKDIYELKNPIRYGALRDLGLTPKEAYLASGGRRTVSDNRAHLHSSVPRSATSPLGEIPRKEFEMARELFSDLSDGEIQKLYRKVKG